MRRFIVIILCIVLCGYMQARAQDMDIELSKLADNLAGQIKDQGKKKVTVLDFTDLQGGSSELGKYVAEQLTVDLVISRKGFSVLDRANLQSILAEHKLAATGLIDPDTAKKFGQFSGVDAIILGTVTPKDQNITLTAKIISTDTAEIIGAGKASFKADASVQQLQSTPAAATNAPSSTGPGADLSDDKPKVVKTFGDLRVELQTLQIVNNGRFQLAMTLTNQNSSKSIWVALNSSDGISPKGSLTDAGGFQFVMDRVGLTGIQSASYGPYGNQQGGFSPALEINPHDSISATVKFTPFDGARQAMPGVCNLQMEFLLGHDFGTTRATVKVNNLVSKIDAK
jgi:TolB-like protein